MLRSVILLSSVVALMIYGAGELAGPLWIIAFLLIGLLSLPVVKGGTLQDLSIGSGYTNRVFIVCLIMYMLSMLAPHKPDHLLAGGLRQNQNIAAANLLKQDPSVTEHNHQFAFTRNKAGTLRMFLLSLCAIGIFFISANLNPQQAMWLLCSLVICGSAFALLGFISQHGVPQGKTLWWTIPVIDGQPVGSFPNRSHFGGYVALIAAPALFLSVKTFDQNKFKSAFWLACSAGSSGVVVASLSRGAWFALLAGLISCIAILRGSKKVITLLGSIVLITALASACLYFIVQSNKLDSDENALHKRAESLLRPLDTESAGLRTDTWKSATRLIRLYPLLGAGPEGFRTVFAQVRDQSHRLSFKHAENEYIQVLTDTGMCGLVLAIIAVSAFISIYKQTRRNVNCDLRTLAIPCLATAGIHALLDFTMHRPLYTLTFFMILGLSCSGLNASQGIQNFKLFDRMLAGTCMLSWLFILSFGSKIYLYDRSFYIETASMTELHEVIEWAPTYWAPWYALGKAHWDTGNPENQAYAEACISQAAIYDRNNYRIWKILCDVRTRLGMIDKADEAYMRAKELRSWLNIKRPGNDRHSE
jgi:hypothetical protein